LLTDATPDARVSAFSPASEPYVIGVGGTSFDFTNNNDLVATRGYDMATGLGARWSPACPGSTEAGTGCGTRS
jgi:subtilase family serine protease